jgi:hypothetical protein
MDDERFTPDELEVLWRAWAEAQRRKDVAVEDVFIPAAYRLERRAWLERRWHGEDVRLSLDAAGRGRARHGRHSGLFVV